ncbi:hypothetical protein [Chitinophaga silvisoli]|uniref:Uncharacterized protein n=1 Tax=Chitinophaga silvisoli TaxID=2291814 RepID=A0A3E1P2V4_9BACT|nr:hypothetical protein [Chitinophaga silvisoli]RFM34444.1 hypothetical protein DXN04_14295 [Chitinophaga silvisoli]
MSRVSENEHEIKEEQKVDKNNENQHKSGKNRKKNKQIDLRRGVSSAVATVVQGEFEIKQTLNPPGYKKRKKDNEGTGKKIRFFDIISIVNDLPRTLQRKIIADCNWSESMYYNKFRVDISPSLINGSTLKVTSHAELKTIIKIYVDIVEERLQILQSMKSELEMEKQ